VCIHVGRYVGGCVGGCVGRYVGRLCVCIHVGR